jgi:dolichol-phosphate mannosyltransferase
MKVILALPAYNEEIGLAAILPAFRTQMHAHRLEHATVVVDDGSTDRTVMVVRDHATVIQHEVNQGLGRTIEAALRHATELAQPGDVIVTMDADNTHPVSLIPRMLARIDEGYDVVLASRYRRGSRTVGLTWLRHVMSYGARAVFEVLCPIPGVRDYTCGFRAYRAEALQRAFANGPVVTERGFASMAEILLRLRKLDMRMCEVPMTLRYDLKDGASKNRIGSTILATLRVAWRNR